MWTKGYNKLLYEKTRDISKFYFDQLFIKRQMQQLKQLELTGVNIPKFQQLETLLSILTKRRSLSPFKLDFQAISNDGLTTYN